MTELEEKVVSRFRELCTKRVGSRPPWSHSIIRIGDRIEHGLERQQEENFHRLTFTLTVDEALRVQQLGIETFMGAILTDAEMIANRKQDGGPIYLLTASKLSRSRGPDCCHQEWFLFLRASDGVITFKRLFRQYLQGRERS